MLARAFLAAILAAVPLASSGYAAEKGVRVRATTYDPRAVQVQAGDMVTWTWEAGPHTVTALDGSFDSDYGCAPSACRGVGHTFSHTFRKPGIYAYRCKVQPAMVGSVEVVEAKAKEAPPPSGPKPAEPPPQSQPGTQGRAPSAQPPPQPQPPPQA
ncbi:MAG: plastocyanin/azurin family copper-binding protein, partial [Actinomycetota bacterium]|nr:plastocyanin/azurin family copper-binding protein [Actinomycetota bacterium]